jgi:hypothetical protein
MQVAARPPPTGETAAIPVEFSVRRRDRAAVAAAAILQIHRTAPPRELRTALEGYLRDEFLDAQRQALADYLHFWSDGDA